MKLTIMALGLAAIALTAAGCSQSASPSQPIAQNNQQAGSMASGSESGMMSNQGMSDNKILAVLFKNKQALTLWPGNELAVLDHVAMLDNNVTVSQSGLVVQANGATVQLQNGQEVDRNGKISWASADLLHLPVMMPENNMMNGSSTGSSMMQKPGSYINYSADALAQAEKGGGRTVIFFHANWCPFCQAADKDFRAHVDKIPAGVTILEADYDTEVALKQQYGITYQDSFVQVDSNGNKLTQWSSGGQGIQALLANLKG